MHPDRHRAAAQPLHRQRVVDFGGLRIVDRERLDAFGQRQIVGDRRCAERRKAGAFGKVLEQKAPPVELVRRIDGAGTFEQFERRALRGARSFDHGLVFGRVLVGLEQDLEELFAHRCRAFARHQLRGPFGDLRQNLLLLLDGGQRLLDDFGRGLLEAPLAGAAEIMRRLEQREKRRGLLHQRRVGLEIVDCEIGKTEFAFGSKFPGQIQVHGRDQRARFGDQLRRRGFLETQDDVRTFDLEAFSGVELDLRRCFGFG